MAGPSLIGIFGDATVAGKIPYGAKGHFAVFPTRGLSYECSPVEIEENKCRINFHFLPSPVTQQRCLS